MQRVVWEFSLILISNTENLFCSIFLFSLFLSKLDVCAAWESRELIVFRCVIMLGRRAHEIFEILFSKLQFFDLVSFAHDDFISSTNIWFVSAAIAIFLFSQYNERGLFLL